MLGSIVVAPRARARRLPHLRQQAATRARSPSCWPSRSCGLLTAAALSVGLAHGEGLLSKMARSNPLQPGLAVRD